MKVLLNIQLKTVFLLIYSKIKLYKALHNEDNDVTEDDITPITLENVLMSNMYNDLGFSVKNKIFILTEAQSTWSVNIIIRMLCIWMKEKRRS